MKSTDVKDMNDHDLFDEWMSLGTIGAMNARMYIGVEMALSGEQYDRYRILDAEVKRRKLHDRG